MSQDLTSRLGGLQDLATAGVAAWAWIDPVGWRRDLVTDAPMVLMIEFLLIHASGMFGLGRDPDQPHPLSTRGAAAMLAFYLGSVVLYAFEFGNPWVIAGAGWLLVAKAWPYFSSGEPRIASYAQRWIWAASVVYFIGAVAATIFLPIPEFGVDRSMALQGVTSGVWIRLPHTAVAAAVLYFGLLALTRLAGWDLRAAVRYAPRPATP